MTPAEHAEAPDLLKALQGSIDRAKADRESERAPDDGIGCEPDEWGGFELQPKMEYEPERTLGSLTAADLGKTITVDGETFILRGIQHEDGLRETWVHDAMPGDIVRHRWLGKFDTPCEVSA